MEKIQTGLTEKYVGYWSVRQAMKEAAQNIAYGATKSGSLPQLHWQDGIGTMEDSYTGFEKRHLYLGESEQRDDVDGLGNFGEGWKVFMLVMARQGLIHGVETVGFDFWGEMEPTPHGTTVLVIHVKDNSRTQGTKVFAQCSQEDFDGAVSSFAALQGLDCTTPCVLLNRRSEFWIAGVRVEQGDNLNPLNLHFSYNVKDRTLVNRDRSQVDTGKAKAHISALATAQSEEFVREFVKQALEGNTKDDIQKGPYFMGVGPGTPAEIWIRVIAEAHNTKPESLVLSSNNPDIDKEAIYKGYKLLRTPGLWADELRYVGFKQANQVVKLKPDYELVTSLSADSLVNLRQAKRDAKKAMGLNSITGLPQIKIVREITTGGGSQNNYGAWDFETQTVYLRADILGNLQQTVRTLIHECVHWMTGEGDNQPGFTKGFEMAILRLLGY